MLSSKVSGQRGIPGRLDSQHVHRHVGQDSASCIKLIGSLAALSTNPLLRLLSDRQQLTAPACGTEVQVLLVPHRYSRAVLCSSNPR